MKQQMGKGIALLTFFFSVGVLYAQDVQLHYDLGKNRKYLTSTVEMFKPDKHGNTYFFIDMDYNSVEDSKGVTLAYWEISRALKFWKGPVAFHTEYNGGFGQWRSGNESGAYQISNAFLNGVEFSWNAKDFSRGFTFQILHKYIQGTRYFSFQLTGVWYLSLFKGRITSTGFADFWRQDVHYQDGITRFRFTSEPQLWYNFNSHFALGGEAETDVNFGGPRGLHCYPTMGAKYTF